MNTELFFIATRESGSLQDNLPLWGAKTENPMALKQENFEKVVRENISSVPGAFQLHNVLSQQECQTFIDTTEALGFTEDAAVSLPRSVRHNNNLTWVTDDTTADIIWQRCLQAFPEQDTNFFDKQALGINGRFRFYKYQQGDFFSIHTDGLAWQQNN